MVVETFHAACASSYDPEMWTGALGYIVQPISPPPGGAGSNLDIEGCATTNPGSEGLSLIGLNVTAPGIFMMSDAAYDDGMGHAMGGTVTIKLQQFGPVGTPIEGSFEGTVSADNDPTPTSIMGTFQVCHTKDAH